MADRVPKNNLLTWVVTFRDGVGAEFDPETVAIKIIDPGGVQSTLNFPGDVIKVSIGVYQGVNLANVSGDWIGKGEGTLPDGSPITTEDVVKNVGKTYVNF